MIVDNFSKFYCPYFLNQDFTVTAVKHATVEQAQSCEFLSEFNWNYVNDLPLQQLLDEHINAIPKGTVFVTAESKVDIFYRAFEKIFIHFGRTDIKFIEYDGNITADFVKLSSNKYFCHGQGFCHVLFKMKELSDQGLVVGSLGPFFNLKNIEDRWIVQEHYSITPYYLFHLERKQQVIPSLAYPLLRSYIKELKMHGLMKNQKHFGPRNFVWMLLHSLKIDSTGIFDNFLFDSNPWNNYPDLINRYWANPAYHPLENFL